MALLNPMTCLQYGYEYTWYALVLSDALICFSDYLSLSEGSVKFKIISRHRNPLGLKDRDDHHLHSDAADRLHLMC